MAEKEETPGGEQDDISFLRTGDIVALNCVSSTTKDGVNSSGRVCMCTEGFGNRMCTLENISGKDVPPDISMCMFFIDNALSVRALQEMMSAEGEMIVHPGPVEGYGRGKRGEQVPGFLFGNDVLRLFHGNDECLTIPENWSDSSHNMVIYEGGNAVNQARSLWRIELIRTKWHGAMVGFEQPFRIRHITTGRYLAIKPKDESIASENALIVSLLRKEHASYNRTAFVMCQNKDPKKQMLDEKEEEGMGNASIGYGETNAFIQHVDSQLWLSYKTSEVTKKGLGKVEEKKAVPLKDGHMDDCYTFFMALEEESKSARVIRKCSSVLNRFLRGIEALHTEGNQANDWNRVDLNEVLKLMEDLIEYFAQPNDEMTFEERQNRFRALRSRQDLFQEEGVLNMILDTIDKFSEMESLPNFAGLIGDENQMIWEEISTYLYLLVAAMIKGNHSNCAQFAAVQRLDWLFGRLSNPQSAEGILDVLYCVLTESPEALNMINEGHIKSVISLLEKVGRDPKVLDVLSSLCEGNGMAVRSSQNTITNHLLPGKDLLLQTAMKDQVSSMMPNILVGLVDGSSLFKKWYFEAEVEHLETMTKTPPLLRVGWANTVGYKPFPGSGDGWGCGGVGDDFYSYGFDGLFMYCSGKARQVGHRVFRKGDVIGCALDLLVPEVKFSLNGQPIPAVFKNFNVDGFFFPVMSMSAKASCRFLFGGNHGRLKYGPPTGFSSVVEALDCPLKVDECLSFGDLLKNTYAGPSTTLHAIEPFIPTPLDISGVNLPSFALENHQRFAENLHELWAMRKIDLGWTYGEVRNEANKRHPCLTSFNQLPETEQHYNIQLALDTMKAIEAAGYHMVSDKPPTRLRPVRLAQHYVQANGYKPQPLDTHEIELSESMNPLIDTMARNTHNVWAKEKIRRGWTFGVSEYVDATQKRSPHLVPYDQVDQRIKEANREAAAENIRALQLFGIFLEAPAIEQDEAAEKEMRAMKSKVRTYRAEATYKVNGGKWYFEFEVLTEGFMKIGWMDISAMPDTKLGLDDKSYGFDGYLCKKWHQGAETYGREWKVGDIVGCFLDLNDRTISFSLNGELLLDPSGSEMAFDNVTPIDGFVPAMTLSAGQRARLNFGQDSNSLKFFTTCGLQEGYEPFCVNMYRQMPMWYSKHLPTFHEISEYSRMEVNRVPPTATSPPCLKISQQTTNNDSFTEKSKMEFIRLSLPIRCKKTFVKNKDREAIMKAMQELQKRNPSIATIKSPGLPKEFEDQSEKKRKSIGKTLLSAFRHSSHDDDARSHTNASFDGSIHDGEPPALSKSSHLDMSNEERALAAEKLRDMTKQGANIHKKSSGLLNRLRERRDKSKDDRSVEKKGRIDEDPKSVKSFDLASATEGSMSRHESRDLLSDMPQSGPGRASFRRGSKKRKNGKKDRSPSMPDTKEHRLSVAPTEVTDGGTSLDDDSFAMTQMADQIDDYYYGVRIFPGQDPANVWVGWVTPQFHSYAQNFNAAEAVRKCRFTEIDHHGIPSDSVEYRNCYMLNAQELLNAVSDGTNTKVSGLLIGCIVDISLGELSFLAAGQDTGMKFKLEPGAMLYPAVFVTPTTQEILQFELGRLKYYFPLSAAMFKSSHKSLVPFCPPRLTVQKLYPRYWSRVPNECLRTTALKLSDVRGWSVLCDDPVRTLMLYIPEKDAAVDILELIEMPDLLTFHRQTLNLYCRLASHGNQKVAHILCTHVDEDQLMYGVKSHFMSGPIRQGVHDFIIAVHLQTHAAARLSTSKEYVVPLVPELSGMDVFDSEAEGRYPHILGSTVSILPVMKYEEIRSDFSQDDEERILPPALNFESLKNQVMIAFRGATENAVMNCRDLIGGDNLNHFEPLLKLFDALLVIGMITDDELIEVLTLIHPIAFDENYSPGTTTKGLTEIELAEGVKLQLVNILDHICDIQLRHRVESLISFSDGFVGDLQADQCQRYMDIKQTDMPPAEAAKRTKEFRCPPKEQMFRLLNCKIKEEKTTPLLDEDVEYDQCPMSDQLQEQLREFCSLLVERIGCGKAEEASPKAIAAAKEDDNSWVDNLAQLVVSVPPAPETLDESVAKHGTENFRLMIIATLKKWAGESEIESNELIRRIFKLLLRQYTGVRELIDAMQLTYVLHDRNVNDVEAFIVYLMQIRELLQVQFETYEEAILKRGLWQLMNNRIFFQHPDLMRLLRVHEDVMTIMMNVLTAQQSAADNDIADESGTATNVKDASEMVVACSRFLCYFCRTSRMNQKAMFEHLSFLLDNATMLLARPSLRGSVPLDVAYSSFMDNNELALALKEEELDKVTIYLSRCGLQSNTELLAKDYPDIGWDPVEGERYLDFLRFCVWINGENVEENANLVIRLLIRRPECLGVALKGEGQGLFAAFKEAIVLSEDIRALEEGEDTQFLHSTILKDHGKYPGKEVEGEDYVDLGAAILDFYSSLVDLLAKCAPDPLTIQAGKGDSVRARAILRSLISLEDLGRILALRFTIPNLALASADGKAARPVPYSGAVPPPLRCLPQFIDTTNTFANIAANLTAQLNATQPQRLAHPPTALHSRRVQLQAARLRRQFSLETSPTPPGKHRKFCSVDQGLRRLTEEETDEDGSVYETPMASPLSRRREPEYNSNVFSIKNRKKGFRQRRSSSYMGPLPGLLPNHKQSILLFLDRGDAEESENTAFMIVEDETGMLKLEEGASGTEERPTTKPDALRQLIQCFQRAATSEENQAVAISDDTLYVNYADVMAQSVHLEDDDDGDDEEVDQAEKEEMAQALRAEQAILADRGAAIMCLMYLSASNGEPTEMVAQTLQLGIHLLSGGNKDIQKILIDYLQLKKDVRFFTSLSTLMGRCSVLNLEMFERQIKAEGLGMGAELAAGDHQNLNDADFTCSLFRFLQLTCEGHNLDFQNYLRSQTGHTTSVNLIISTVDYLLRLQESVMDFYWHYSSKEVIDEGGKEYFLRAIRVCSQVFNTLTESIQGPCVGNQMTLANSRLWDAINGFFFLFAHMMEKLYKNSTQLELLREFLNLQKDMIVLMLSMLEGNVLNGPIGKQMVDALVESQQCVEMILKFSDMFLKLKDLTTSQAFQDFDTNRDGWISPKEFQRAMEQQKMYSVEEITYLMMCTDVNNDGKVDYMEFTERFHNPARDIGFNLAVLLTNLKEHITNDPRLEKIVEKASSLLEYFDPFLGRIEIMGSSKRVEKIYFEIQESWLEQWSKQQIRDSKNAFLFNVLQDDGGDQGKLEAFINFCEDTIFEMQHAAEISSGDSSDSKVERAMKQRDYFLQQTTAGQQISKTLQRGYDYGISAAEALKPANMNKTIKLALQKFRTMTWAQLLVELLKFGFKLGKGAVLLLWFFVCTMGRFAYYLTSPEYEDEEAKKRVENVQQEQTAFGQHHNFPTFFPTASAHRNVDAFGVHISHDEMNGIPPDIVEDEPTEPKENSSNGEIPEDPRPNGNVYSETPTEDDAFLKVPQREQKRPSVYDTQSFASAQAPVASVSGVHSEDLDHHPSPYYEPKIAEQMGLRSKGSVMNVLARNFKTIEKITLYLAFFINVILLFHRVDIAMNPDRDEEEDDDADDDDDTVDEVMESIYIAGMIIPYFAYEITGWLLAQVLYWLSVMHAVTSFALLIAFYQLKIPLITFKREKEVARKLMFDGCWITEEESEERSVIETLFWYMDRIVISAKSFPVKYWDKFVRRKTKQKYKEQVDEETLEALLGTERSPGDTSFDYRYNCWLWVGVILTNGQFLYRVMYLVVSSFGVAFSPFFYAFLLIDVVLSFPMLKAILQSVTHNLQQLILTIMMTLVVVYLYTVVAFNFFRKFYIQDGEEGEEPDRKCHYMLTCFIYHFYAGVRAGGGIGDELESPYGDDLEYPRMLYDISFFFFVIVILLAIMQGLIIDAFGELRDQQESATEKLESSCFICDIGKDTFDRMPRGFEIHTTKEHNFANYLFFLQHLVNKDETEYTGQETYVREKYDNRDWEFFPVGECFMKQYEDQLLQT
uniref:MIR domain-containing protein n=1 Tax=Bursaphelenchus xylophilus TaxID=6326 RepID=A0A1I7RX29_BURXY